MVDVLLRALKPTQTVIILRIRYAEDRLQEAISSGVQQYVILGAGLDTFALRQPSWADRLRIYEVDHPASQEMKRHQIQRIGPLPSNLTLVPVDFETDRLDAALIEAGFDPEAPAFFAWLGVTCYLTREAVTDTIGQIAAVAAPGSKAVLDYRYPRRLVPAAGLALVEKMDRFVERRGEPMRSEYTPEEIDAEMQRAGLHQHGSRLAGGADATLPAGPERHPRATTQLRVRAVQKEPLDRVSAEPVTSEGYLHARAGTAVSSASC